jgi:hypothetical protein
MPHTIPRHQKKASTRGQRKKEARGSLRAFSRPVPGRALIESGVRTPDDCDIGRSTYDLNRMRSDSIHKTKVPAVDPTRRRSLGAIVGDRFAATI